MHSIYDKQLRGNDVSRDSTTRAKNVITHDCFYEKLRNSPIKLTSCIKYLQPNKKKLATIISEKRKRVTFFLLSFFFMVDVLIGD